jgi:membrane peptidoglycan carboxypeptidase
MPNAIHIVRDRRARRRRAKSGLRSMRPWFVGLLLMAVMIIFASITAGAVIVLGVYSEVVVDLPSAASLELAFQTSSNQFFQTTKVFDRTGQKVLYEVIDPRAGDRQWLDLEQIPVRFQTATISIEDKTFYQNAGYDLLGMLRAFGANLSRPICVLRPEDCPGLIQGGSTITQQLVKNVIIAPGMYADTSYSRKLREVLIAREATTKHKYLSGT